MEKHRKEYPQRRMASFHLLRFTGFRREVSRAGDYPICRRDDRQFQELVRAEVACSQKSFVLLELRYRPIACTMQDVACLCSSP